MAEMKNLTINGTPFTLPFAPAGYGLGTYGKECSDCNNEIANGFYSLSGSTLQNGPSADSHLWYGSMIVANRLGNMIEQIAFYDNRAAFRSRIDDVQGEWEYLNPRMILGIEYRTTERWNGNVVYTKLVDLGAAANSKKVELVTGVGKIIRHESVMNDNSALPFINETLDNAYSIWTCVDNAGTAIKIFCGSSRVDTPLKATIWYVK